MNCPNLQPASFKCIHSATLIFLLACVQVYSQYSHCEMNNIFVIIVASFYVSLPTLGCRWKNEFLLVPLLQEKICE